MYINVSVDAYTQADARLCAFFWHLSKLLGAARLLTLGDTSGGFRGHLGTLAVGLGDTWGHGAGTWGGFREPTPWDTDL